MENNDLIKEANQKIGAVFSNFKEKNNKAYSGYMQIRQSIFPEGAEGAIPGKYKHLIFALFDLERAYDEGYRAHIGAAVQLGLTSEELSEALNISLILTGVSTFLRGYELIEFVESNSKVNK